MSRVPIGAIAEVIRGVSFDKVEASDRPAGGRVPILRAGNIKDQLITDEDLIWVPEARVAPHQFMQPGDIALCASSGSPEIVGKSALLSYSWHGSVGAFCLIIRPDRNQCEPAFLAWFLRTKEFRAWTRQSQGINIKNVRKAELATFQIPLPPLDEQRRIVNILNRANSIRRLRREAVDKTRQLIPAVFLDMFGDPRQNRGNHTTRPLRDVAEIGSGITKGRKLEGERLVEAPYIRVANVQDGFLNLKEIKHIPVRPSELVKYALKPGDLLMTEGGDPDKLGRAALWNDEVANCVHQNHVFRVRAKQDVAEPLYLRALAGSLYGKQYFLRVAKRTTGIASINKTQLGNFPVLLPPLGSQRDFAERATDIQATIAQQEQMVEACDQLIASLMAQLFDGGSERRAA